MSIFLKNTQFKVKQDDGTYTDAINAIAVDVFVDGESSGSSVELDTTLTQAGKAAESKTVGTYFEQFRSYVDNTFGKVKSVNGNTPDASGNVVVNTGSGSSVELDTTLTQAGKAADAKATGDAIAEKVSFTDFRYRENLQAGTHGFEVGDFEFDTLTEAGVNKLIAAKNRILGLDYDQSLHAFSTVLNGMQTTLSFAQGFEMIWRQNYVLSAAYSGREYHVAGVNADCITFSSYEDATNTEYLLVWTSDGWVEEKVRTVGANNEAPNYGKLVVFGDSLSAGYGNANGYSWVSRLRESGRFTDVKNFAVSGSTFGDYAVDANVTKQNAVAMIRQHSADVANADMIILEYGGNDGKAIKAGKLTWGGLQLALDAAIIEVKKYNQTAPVIYVCSGYKVQTSYTPDLDDCFCLFGQVMFELYCSINNVQILNPYKGTEIGYRDHSFMQSDNVHPTIAGAKKMGDSLLKQIDTGYTAPRPRIVEALLTDNNDLKLDHATLCGLSAQGVDLRFACVFSAYPNTVFKASVSEYSASRVVITMVNKTSSDVKVTGFHFDSDGSSGIWP